MAEHARSGGAPAGKPSASGPAVALIHDWVVDLGGAERVLAVLHAAFPEAPLYTLFARAESLARLAFPPAVVTASWLQALPSIQRHYRSLLPLFPLAVRSLKVADYDLVVSSSHAVAKGVRTRPGQPHLCYCHTPMRYAWDMEAQYLAQHRLHRGWRAGVARAVLARIRDWDRRSAVTVTRFVANSRATAARIARCYGRPADVVFPPVDVDRFQPRAVKDDFFLFASRLVPYKRADLAVRACARLGLRLVVVGDGPAAAVCRRDAGPRTEFLGRQDDATVADLMARARALVFPGEEDFGIVMVEAQAAGTPVIAYGRGGACDSVVPADGANWDRATGLYAQAQTVEGMEAALQAFLGWEGRFQSVVLRRHAEQFAAPAFVARMRRIASETAGGWGAPAGDSQTALPVPLGA